MEAYRINASRTPSRIAKEIATIKIWNMIHTMDKSNNADKPKGNHKKRTAKSRRTSKTTAVANDKILDHLLNNVWIDITPVDFECGNNVRCYSKLSRGSKNSNSQSTSRSPTPILEPSSLVFTNEEETTPECNLYCKESIGPPTPREEDERDNESFRGDSTAIQQELQNRLLAINTSLVLSPFSSDEESTKEGEKISVEIEGDSYHGLEEESRKSDEEDEEDGYDINLFNAPLSRLCIIS